MNPFGVAWARRDRQGQGRVEPVRNVARVISSDVVTARVRRGCHETTPALWLTFIADACGQVAGTRATLGHGSEGHSPGVSAWQHERRGDEHARGVRVNVMVDAIGGVVSGAVAEERDDAVCVRTGESVVREDDERAEHFDVPASDDRSRPGARARRRPCGSVVGY